MNEWYRSGLLGVGLAAILASATVQADGHAAPERYRVKPGDTLWEITERYRGAAEEWPIIGDTNRVTEPRHIQPGDVLVLPPLPELTAEVRHRQGAAWLIREAEERVSLREDMIVAPGDAVETGPQAFVSLHLPHDEDVVLPSNTRVVLKRQDRRNARLYLERGELEARVPAQRDHQEVLNVDTPTGIIGVRGTHFRVAHANDGTRVSTWEGEVALGHAESTSSVPSGQGAFSREGAATRVTSLLPAPRVGNSEFSVDQPLRIEVSAVSGAETYRVQLARDPHFQTLFRDKRADSRTIAFDSLPQGFYYVRSSAFDALGIEGRHDSRLILHRPVEVKVESNGNGYTFRWSDIPRLSYRLQLSEDARFHDPFMDRPFEESQGVTLRNLPTDDFFWRLQVSGTGGELLEPTVVASGRQGAVRQP